MAELSFENTHNALYSRVSSPCSISGVYAIRHVESGRCYIGSSVRIGYRWYQHKALLRQDRHHSVHLQRAWAKYGESAFEFVVLEAAPADQLIAREQAYIDAARVLGWDHCFNTSPTAGSPFGCKHGPCSPERKAKIGAANRGRVPSAKTREKQATAKRGRILSDSVRAKMRTAQAERRAAERATRPTKPDTRAWQWLSVEQFWCAVAFYQTGASMDAVARAFSITKSSFASRMKRRGIPARKWHGGRV